jgi:hypothetical protein
MHSNDGPVVLLNLLLPESEVGNKRNVEVLFDHLHLCAAPQRPPGAS